MISFSQIIFQKELRDITRADLETFFSEPQEESHILEFKEGGTDLKKIHSEVAAFLNTEGGLIIYGAPREIDHPTKKGYKIAQGALTPCTVRDKDVISRSLGTGIAPAPSAIKIHVVEIEGGAVYLIEVGQSQHPPHQVSDSGKYYTRFEREAKGATHGHVEAMFFRRQRPNVKATIIVSPVKSNKIEDDKMITVTFTVVNHSMVTAENWGYVIALIGVDYCYDHDKEAELEIESEQAKTYNFHNNSIIVKGLSMSVSLKIRPVSSHFVIIPTFYAKDMEAIPDYYLIREDGEIVKEIKNSDETEDEVFDVFVDIYDQTLIDIYSSLLRPFSGGALTPAKTNRPIMTHFEKIGISLPPSYLRFFMVSDGLNGFVGNQRCRLWSMQQMINLSNDQYSFKDAENYSLFIGDIDLNDIYMNVSAGNVDFRVYTPNGAGQRTRTYRIAKSFPNLIRKIAEGQNLANILSNRLPEFPF